MFVTASYYRNSLDIRWENPVLLPENKLLEVVGVNLYRSFDDQLGNYEKINDIPLGALYYRDKTEDVGVASEEIDFSQFGVNPQEEFVIQVSNFPIVKPGYQAEVSRSPLDVVVKVNGVKVPVSKVDGAVGQILLSRRPVWDPKAEVLIQPVTPEVGDDVVCDYTWNRRVITGNAGQRTFYRVTTVLSDDSETPLGETFPHWVDEVESLDYIWKEAIRRNGWILDQGGERVLVYLRKWAGVKCSCYDYEHEHAANDCPLCYGTSFTGGYEGPYAIKITPRDAERKRKHTNAGYVNSQSQEVWTSPSPVLAHWDFIVKQNGERFSIGALNPICVRGAPLQQQFQMGLLPDTDIRYRVLIPGQSPSVVPDANTGYLEPIGSDENPVGPPPPPPSVTSIVDASPVITENPDVEVGVRVKGRTVTFDNISY